MEVTKQQYERALDVLSKVEQAKKAKEAYEEQQRWTEDPIQSIIEQGKVEFVAGERIRNSDMIWRATQLRYVHEKGTVERTIVYSTDVEAKNLLGISKDETKLI